MLRFVGCGCDGLWLVGVTGCGLWLQGDGLRVNKEEDEEESSLRVNQGLREDEEG